MLIAAASIFLCACGKTIADKTYPVNAVFINSLYQPITIKIYEGNKSSIIEVKAKDSAIISEKNEERTPRFLLVADSSILTFGANRKIDRLCSKVSGDNSSCLNDQANLLAQSQYAVSSKNETAIYRYVIGSKDSLEATMK